MRLPAIPILRHHRCSAWTWFTYPHSNGFLADGRSLVLGRFDGSDTVLSRCPLDSGREEELFRFPAPGPDPLVRWYDISLRGDRLLTLIDDRVLVADLSGDGRLREVYRSQGDWRLHVSDIPTISGDGRRTIFRERTALRRAHAPSVPSPSARLARWAHGGVQRPPWA